MDELLASAFDAHGGLRNWAKVLDRYPNRLNPSALWSGAKTLYA